MTVKTLSPLAGMHCTSDVNAPVAISDDELTPRAFARTKLIELIDAYRACGLSLDDLGRDLIIEWSL